MIFRSFTLIVSLFLCAYAQGSFLQEKETSTKNFLRDIESVSTPTGMPMVDCIYVINLDKRPERLQKVFSEFASHGLFLTRIQAIDGSCLTTEQKKELQGPYSPDMTGGMFGCLLSHVSAYQHACKNNFSLVWILEDDATIVGDIQQIPSLIQELSTLDPDWDILYTDTYSRTYDEFYIIPDPSSISLPPDRKNLTIRPREDVSANFVTSGFRYGTHSYILSRKGMSKLQNYFLHTFVWAPIDVDIHFIPELREYCTKKEIVRAQKGSSSDTFYN